MTSELEDLYAESWRKGRAQGSAEFPAFLESPVSLPALPPIIGLTGHYGSGKDATAALLGMLGYERRAFADEVRKEAAGFVRAIHDWYFHGVGMGGNRSATITIPYKQKEFMDCATAYRNDLCHCIAETPIAILEVELWSKPTTRMMREILQRHGAEFRREKYGEDYWVRKVLGDLAPPFPPLLTISDVRFENEAAAIRDLGGVIWKIERKTELTARAASDPHISESGQSMLAVEAVIDNSGTLWDLRTAILRTLGRTDRTDRPDGQTGSIR